MKTRLTYKKAITADANGREFAYQMWSVSGHLVWNKAGKLVRECNRKYQAFGLETKTLDELKRLVAKLP